MKINSINRVRFAIFSFIALILLSPSQLALAAANSISISPSSQSVEPGATFTISVDGFVGSNPYPATQVSGTMTFPNNLLKVTSVSTSGSSYTWQNTATPDNTNGTVTFTENNEFYTGPSGSIHIISITFQALSDGTAQVGFSPGTTFSNTTFGINFSTSLSGGTYTIATAAPPSCPTGQIGTPPNCQTPTCPSGESGTPPNCQKLPAPTPTPTPTPKPTPTPTKPAQTTTTPTPTPTPTPTTTSSTPFSISDTSTTRGYNTAAIDWKTSAAASGVVTYGLSLKELNQNATVILQQDGSYEAKLTGLVPGKQYYFTIAATAAADATKTDSYSGTFTTKGYPVVVTITENGSPVISAKLSIGEQNYSTDRTGKATLELASGSYSVLITTPDSSATVKLAVANKTIPDSGPPASQGFTFDIPAPNPSTNNKGTPLTAIIGIGVGSLLGLLLLLGLFFLYRQHKQQNKTSLSTTDSDYSILQQPEQPLPAFPQEQIIAASNPPIAAIEQPEPMAYIDPGIPQQPPINDLPANGSINIGNTSTDLQSQANLAQPEMMSTPEAEQAAYPLTAETVATPSEALEMESTPQTSYAESLLTNSTDQQAAIDNNIVNPTEETPVRTEESTATELENEESIIEERMAPPTTTSGAGELQISHEQSHSSSHE